MDSTVNKQVGGSFLNVIKGKNLIQYPFVEIPRKESQKNDVYYLFYGFSISFLHHRLPHASNMTSNYVKNISWNKFFLINSPYLLSRFCIRLKRESTMPEIRGKIHLCNFQGLPNSNNKYINRFTIVKTYDTNTERDFT